MSGSLEASFASDLGSIKSLALIEEYFIIDLYLMPGIYQIDAMND